MIGTEFKAICRGYYRMAVPCWVRITMADSEGFIMEIIMCDEPHLLRPSEPYVEWWRSKMSYDLSCRTFNKHFHGRKPHSCRFMFDTNGDEIKPNPYER